MGIMAEPSNDGNLKKSDYLICLIDENDWHSDNNFVRFDVCMVKCADELLILKNT